MNHENLPLTLQVMAWGTVTCFFNEAYGAAGGGLFLPQVDYPAKGLPWFEAKFLHVLTPVSIIALLATLVLLFSFKGETIVSNPLTILWIAIPLFIQTVLIFVITYVAAKLLRFTYEDAAPSAMIGASNHFEVAIADGSTDPRINQKMATRLEESQRNRRVALG